MSSDKKSPPAPAPAAAHQKPKQTKARAPHEHKKQARPAAAAEAFDPVLPPASELAFVDAHCHIDDEQFDNDRSAVLKAGAEAGVKGVIAVSMNSESAVKVLELHKQFPSQIFPCIGLHPCAVHGLAKISMRELDRELKTLTSLVEKNRDCIAGIGEVGLDFSPWIVPSDEEKNLQRQVFQYFIGLANKFDLPLNVHSRNASHYVVDMLIDHGAKSALLHAFDGRPAVALKAAKAGYFFSIPPSIQRNPHTQKLAGAIPAESLVLETDSPALSHIKAERNTPANISVSLLEVSKIKRVPPSKLVSTFFANSKRLFPILKSL